ncbi:DUF397 domain-containing protein [Embleya sp. NPDC020886]|uniref:DUF397 domain-containing protein n=1 Tax=Embleya sp. NPDC020886 TaxID=3363980 RepID=UPI0037908DD7
MSSGPTPQWRTSTWSQHNQECVEIARFATATGIRDTKDRARGHLEISATAWAELVRTLKS